MLFKAILSLLLAFPLLVGCDSPNSDVKPPVSKPGHPTLLLKDTFAVWKQGPAPIAAEDLSQTESDIKFGGEVGDFLVMHGEDAQGKFIKVTLKDALGKPTALVHLFYPLNVQDLKDRDVKITAILQVNGDATCELFYQDKDSGDWKRQQNTLAEKSSLKTLELMAKPRPFITRAEVGFTFTTRDPNASLIIRGAEISVVK